LDGYLKRHLHALNNYNTSYSIGGKKYIEATVHHVNKKSGMNVSSSFHFTVHGVAQQLYVLYIIKFLSYELA